MAQAPRPPPLKIILRLLGLLTALFSLTMIPPMLVGWWYSDGAVTPFAITLISMLMLGVLCWLPVRRIRGELRTRDGFVVVVLFWLVLSGISAMPLILAEKPATLVDAIFEATSGLTTTGATVLYGINQLPHAILYYRAQLHFLGGMGIIVLAVALLPMLGIGGMQLYRAETPGPMKDEKITPRIAETAKRLWLVYVALNVLCITAFWLAGMGLFDAIAHSFATLALGGFSTHDASIGHFNSPAIELVAGAFSFLAGVNFALHYLVWHSFRQKPSSLGLTPLVRDPEFRLYCKVIAVLVTVTCGYLYLSGTMNGWAAFHHGFFQTLSITTDNGLVTAGYPEWPLFVVLLLLMASFFGGCAGSTCGGIKAVRFLLLSRQSVRELKLLIRPYAQVSVKIGGRSVPSRVVQAVWGFYFLYIFSYCIVSLALVATGLDIVTAFGSVAGCLNNMGVGLGASAVHFGELNDIAKWLLIFSMLVGRLEVFPLLLLFLPDFWR
ncbi:MAG: potassium transporter [Candidatus Competibacteraceae bacterium]|nr:potassium transporter [Candidatus Competibacteraceae bacterium]